ncbi:MAG: zinc ribbon domain-containing protein [Clostridia bacterium]
MYCPKCGKEISNEAVLCVHCGAQIGKIKNGSGIDDNSPLWLVLGILVPLIGLVLFLIWKDEKPVCAKQCGKGALIGFCISFGISILYFVASLFIPVLFAIPLI